jgi:hypothetical protein
LLPIPAVQWRADDLRYIRVDVLHPLRDGADRGYGITCCGLTDEISLVISAVAFAVCAASDFTSEATTAKPRPASPAHAAYSIVALSARRFDAVEAEQINYGDAHRQTDRAR